MNFNEVSLSDYLNFLASSSPTPGGGSVAALMGAQAAALLSMVCQLTFGKKKFIAVEDEISKLLTIFESQQNKMFKFAQEDAKAFNKVMTAYRLPQKNDSDVSNRSAIIQKSLKSSAEVPFRVFSNCIELLPLADRLEVIANPMVLSDIEVAKHLIHACISSAIINVEVNLDAIKDQGFCEEKRKKMDFYDEKESRKEL